MQGRQQLSNEISQGITIDPAVMDGKPVIKGTRIPVDLILEKLSANRSVDELLSDYPELNIDQVKDCLRYAALTVEKKRKLRKHMIPW
jgi:uncharacterized protein (DUF433 family)